MAIKLGEIDVNVLSGPVSMYYLFPTVDGLPIVLLFGDYHFSVKNMAQECDEEDGCYTVYSDSFLLALDQLANEYPVDFYLEFIKDHPTALVDNVMAGRLKHKVYGCLDVKKRSSALYEEACPTRNIRFHYTDVRFNPNYIESEIVAIYQPYFESLPLIGSVLKTPNASPTILESFHSICVLVGRTGRANKQVGDILYDIVEDKKSICGKQIRNVPLQIAWKRIFQFEDADIADYKKLYQGQPALVEEVLSAMFESKDLVVRTIHQYIVSLVGKILLIAHSWFLDLYTVARMLKPPRDNTSSYLTLGMFGDRHTQNIVRFLKEEVAYTSFYEHPTERTNPFGRMEDNVSRKITPLRVIDVNSHLKALFDLRSDKPDRYLEKLAAERQSRDYGRYQLKGIDERATRLYGLRQLERLRDYSGEGVGDLVTKISPLFGLDQKEEEYLAECSGEMFRFIVETVCRGLYNIDLLPVIQYAAVVASLKQIFSEREVYQKLASLIESFRYKVVDMVTDMEIRTDYKLCGAREE